MANETQARSIAAKLNPIISNLGAADTISNAAAVIDSLGHLLSSANADAETFASLFRMTGAISSALNFELEARNV